MNVESIIARADRCYKSYMLSWTREVTIPLSELVGRPVAGDIRIMVMKACGGPCVSYQLGEVCIDGKGFAHMWNSPKKSARLNVSRWTEKACEVAFLDAVKNAEVVAKELAAQQ